MKEDFLFELRRKSIHIMTMALILLYIFVLREYNKETALLTLLFVLIIFFMIDYYRIEKKKKIPLINSFWRKKEKERFGGNFFMILGAVTSFAVFDFDVALAVLLMTVFGDTASALIGKQFGKYKFKNGKSWEGSIAGFIVNLAIGTILLNDMLIVIIMALVASYVETKLVDCTLIFGH